MKAKKLQDKIYQKMSVEEKYIKMMKKKSGQERLRIAFELRE